MEGNSALVVTTLSPGFHGKPAATMEIPSDVFLTKATSSEVAPARRAKRALASFPTSAHRRILKAPSSRERASMALPAAADRAGMGATAAWFR